MFENEYESVIFCIGSEFFGLFGIEWIVVEEEFVVIDFDNF